MKSKFKVQRLNREWEMNLRRDKANKTTKKRVRRYTHVQLRPTLLYTFTEYFVFICNTANSQYLYADIADIQLNCWLSTTSHCYSGLLRVLLDLSGILSATGVNELLSSSIQGDNPRGVVDTSLHTLERKKSGVEEGRNGEGREMENGKTQKEKQVEVL